MRNGPYELVIAPKEYPGKKYRGRYVYEHHLVWWQNTGKTVPKGFLLHHKNEKKRDNRFSNLELKSVSEHTREHCNERAPKPITVTCGWCSKPLTFKPYRYRQRINGNKSGKVFCNQSCGANYQFQ